MNWGYRILLLYLSFVGAILFMVFTAAMQTNEMEDDQYYVKELKFQQYIDGKNNLNKLNTKPTYSVSNEFVHIQLPVELSKNIKNGKIRFLKPDAKKFDLNLSLQVDNQGKMYIPISSFVKGFYKVQIEWTHENVFYYNEQELKI
jgi:hypothetical protein